MKLFWGLTVAGLVGACGPVQEEIATDQSAQCNDCDIYGNWTGDNGADDVADTFAGAKTISLGGTFTDEINTYSDQDYFKFYQTAGVLTRVSVSGADCWLHYKTSVGTYPESSYRDSNPDPGICYIQFAPTVSRYWYIRVARVDGHYGVQATTGASKPCAPQAHSPLVEGGPLDGYGPDQCCVPLVCQYDGYCCGNWWDAQCVNEAHEWCGW